MQAHKAGRLRDAVPIYQQVIQEEPSNGQAHHYLALALMQARAPHQAYQPIKRASELLPNDPSVHANHGKIALACKDYDQAIEAFRKAATINPRDIESLTNLGTLYDQMGRADEAVPILEQAIAAKAHPKTAMALGAAKRHVFDTPGALAAYQTALNLDPKLTEAAVQVAAAQTELGAFEEAAKSLKQALSVRSNHPGALAALLSLKTDSADEHHITAAEALLNSGQLREDDESRLAFGLARAYERSGRYDEAFSSAQRANAILARRTSFNAADLAAELDRIKSVFTKERIQQLQDMGSTSNVPVLIVGLPRTGTTLTEQILASHPEGEGAGELADLATIPQTLATACSSSYPECLQLDEAHLAQPLQTAADGYLKALTARFPAANRIADKFPFNFSQVGLFACLFPHGTIVHCHRDPRDVFLSCFMTEFNEGLQGFRTSQDNFIAYYQLYREMMDHWESVLPDRIGHVAYRDTVENFDTSVRELIAHTGLAWHGDCANFFKTQRSVRTPSRWQVRQPIYIGSLNKWRKYETHLQPLSSYIERCGIPDW